jgi:hypothetical protein
MDKIREMLEVVVVNVSKELAENCRRHGRS